MKMKSVLDGARIFFFGFVVLFSLNLFGIRFFTDALYGSEGLVLAFLFCVINIMFMKL
jgi:hypothetical protein